LLALSSSMVLGSEFHGTHNRTSPSDSSGSGQNLSTQMTDSQSKLCYDRRSLGQSLLISCSNLGQTVGEFVVVGLLWRGDGSVHSCCSLPSALSLSGLTGFMAMFTYSDKSDSHDLEVQVPVFISVQEQGDPVTPQALHFFESQSQIYLRLSVCCQSVCLGVKPLERHD
jgi:hypothetical protein